MESLRDEAPSGNTEFAFSISAGEPGPPVSTASFDGTSAMVAILHPGATSGAGTANRPPVGNHFRMPWLGGG